MRLRYPLPDSMSTEKPHIRPTPQKSPIESTWTRGALLKTLFLLLVGYPFLKYGFIETWEYVGDDFDVFCIAAEKILNGESPYPDAVFDPDGAADKEAIYGEYVYPAWFAGFMIPFTFLPRFPAKLVYLFLSLLLYGWLVFPWKEFRSGRNLHAGVAVAVMLGWAPVIQNIRFGQSNLVPLLLFAASWRILSRDPDAVGSPKSEWLEWVCGFLFGLGATVKITPLLFAPLLAVTEKWRLLGGLLFGFGTGLLLSGPRNTYDYFGKVFPLAVRLPSLPNSYSLSTFLDSLSTPAVGASLGPLLCVILYVGLALYLRGRREALDSPTMILVGCLAPTLFAGLWLHHYVVAVLPLSVAVATTAEIRIEAMKTATALGRWRMALFLFLVALCLLPGFNYWYPVKAVIDAILLTLGLRHSALFVPGYVLAVFLLFPDLLKGSRPNV